MKRSTKLAWKDSVVELMILEMLRLKGFSKVDELAVQLLREIFLTSINNIMKKTKDIAECNQRSEVNAFDLLKVLESDGYDVDGLTEYAKKNKDRFKDSKQISDSKFIFKRNTGS
jgi:histone H3/H4